jgi:hypothetical protein
VCNYEYVNCRDASQPLLRCLLGVAGSSLRAELRFSEQLNERIRTVGSNSQTSYVLVLRAGISEVLHPVERPHSIGFRPFAVFRTVQHLDLAFEQNAYCS